MVSSRCRALDRLDRVDRSEADRDSVPGVYHADEEGKLHFLLIREMSVEPGIILVGRMGVGDAGQRLGPGQGGPLAVGIERALRSEEHTSELQSLMRISYAVFCLKKKPTLRSNLT